MRKWTDAQSEAIYTRKGPVLVSAAAGSGKTSVLVQRLIEKITDIENPCPADKLLVVTYTKAAASEMKERVSLAVSQLILEDPSNRNLQNQQMLIPQMNISTVHSFCSKICKEYFYLLDISPDFKIVSDKQKEDLMYTAVKQACDEFMEQGKFDLANLFSSERSDYSMYQAIIKMFEFANSHINPNRWINERADVYLSDADIENTAYGKIIIDYVKNALDIALSLCKDNLSLIEKDEVYKEAYTKTATTDYEFIQTALENYEIKSWNEILESINLINFVRLGKLPKDTPEDLKIIFKSKRDMCKKQVAKAQEYIALSSEICRQDMGRIYPIAKELCDITIRFTEIYNALKKEKNFLDYGDLEHFALEILTEEKNGIMTTSQIAHAISENYDEIMIDEYQDTNDVQDAIFSALSKNESNKFMVGDLKQCIYSFRQANPKIFSNYKNNSDVNVINLDQNFRSRENIIHTVNFIFSSLMSPKVGGVMYQGLEKLSLGASYEESKNLETQLDFLIKDQNEDEDEARHISQRIKDMIDSGFLVSDRGEQRPATYKDFCVLLRNTSSHAKTYADILEENGVPAKAQSSSNFFESKEIMQAISFLQVIDNPNQDIALLAVLMGPVYGFTASEMASIRHENNKISIFSSIRLSKDERFKKFLSDIDDLRIMSTCMPSDLFIDTLYEKTNFKELFSCMNDGETRIYNLKLLRQYAGDYESSGYIGISGFVRFIESLKKNKSDMESASLSLDNTNVVEIMSIHKSKGLEFPICIVANCGKTKMGERDSLVLSSKLGIGVKLKSEITGAKYSNFIRDAIILQNKFDEISEELRVLYVATTRAKEKLIFVSTISNLENSLANVSSFITEKDQINENYVNQMDSFAKWLLISALKHPDGRELRKIACLEDDVINYHDFTPWEINVGSCYKKTEKIEKAEEITAELDEKLYDEIKEKLSFEYPNLEINKLQAKVSASIVAEKTSVRKKTLARPNFISEQGLNSAEKGTALHQYLQFADFKKAQTEPMQELERLLEKGFITKTQAEVLEFSKIKTFLNSKIGQRIIESPSSQKELRFSSRIPASLAYKEYSGDEMLILQGAIDCAFEENGKIYIVDFKTDRISDPDELASLYGIQLKLYAKALEKIKNLEVGACYLYSFHMGREVEIK